MRSVPTGEPFPAFTLPTLGGRLLSLADFAGKRVVFTCWASFDPSREDLPAWQDLARRPAKNPFEVVGVAIDVTGAALPMKLMLAKRATFTCLVDAMGLLPRLLGFNALPRTFAVDEAGWLRHRGDGPDTAFMRDLSIFLDSRRDPCLMPPVRAEHPRHDFAKHDTSLDRILQQATNFTYKNRLDDAVDAMRRAVAAAPDNAILRSQLDALLHPGRYYPT